MKNPTLTQGQFLERLLTTMDQKHHWAWAYFTYPTITKSQLKVHFQQEFAVYIQNFPVYLARIYGRNPPMEVRRMLAENIYEEDTGGLSLGHSHPKLFLNMMEGLGYKPSEFENVSLLPHSKRYQAWLEQASIHSDWCLGAAIFTIFVEGSIKDREELRNGSKPKTHEEIETHVNQHPLVKHQGIDRSCMDLVRAHQLVEGGHRHDAYTMVVNYTKDRRQQDAILAALQKTLKLWLQYRNDIARACGLTRQGAPPLTASLTNGKKR